MEFWKTAIALHFKVIIFDNIFFLRFCHRSAQNTIKSLNHVKDPSLSTSYAEIVGQESVNQGPSLIPSFKVRSPILRLYFNRIFFPPISLRTVTFKEQSIRARAVPTTSRAVNSRPQVWTVGDSSTRREESYVHPSARRWQAGMTTWCAAFNRLQTPGSVE